MGCGIVIVLTICGPVYILTYNSGYLSRLSAELNTISLISIKIPLKPTKKTGYTSLIFI